MGVPIDGGSISLGCPMGGTINCHRASATRAREFPPPMVSPMLARFHIHVMKMFHFAAATAVFCVGGLRSVAAPLLSPATPVYGGIVSGGNFVTGTIGSALNTNNWPSAEPPGQVVDGESGTKHVNFHTTDTAFIFSGSVARVASRMQISVPNDAPERDPASYRLYGTNVAIPALTSGNTMAVSTFTLISSGNLTLPDARFQRQMIPIANTVAYTSYLLVFPTIKNGQFAGNAMQLAEVQLYDPGVIGVEQFDYADGSISGKDGGTFWSFRNFAPTGQTGAASTWDNFTGAPNVIAGKLVTQETSAKREYNGTLESDGAVNDPDSGPSSVAKSVYYRLTVKTGATVPGYMGISSYDFGDEKIFFGKRSGQPKFGIDVVGVGGNDSTGPDVLPNTTYTLVAKLDYVANTVRLYVNPNFNAAEPGTAQVTHAYTGTNWSTSVRLASGGGGDAVTWDDLVVGTSWHDIGTEVTTVADEDDLSLTTNSPVSLREAVKYSPPGSLITLAPALSGQTATLTHAEGDIEISNPLTIDASGLPGGLILNGGNTCRIMTNNATGGQVRLTGLTFTGGNGVSPTTIGAGGAFLAKPLTTTVISRCTFFGNNAEHAGALLNQGSMTISDSVLYDNRASFQSGAIQNEDNLTLLGCTLTGNTAGYSGGGVRSQNRLTIRNSTICYNKAATTGGGGIDIYACAATLENSIVWGNASSGSPDDIRLEESPFGTFGANIAGAISQFGTVFLVGTTPLTGDPKLTPLGYFGGPTMTMHPLIGSPAIDAAGTTNPGGTDARGFPRFVDGDTFVGAQLDIGAVEAGRLLIITEPGDAPVGANFRNAMSISPIVGPGARLAMIAAVSPLTLTRDELIPPADYALFIDASTMPGGLIISGNNASRVFNIPATSTVAMHSVKIINGKAPDGSGTVSGLQAGPGQDGGGILNVGALSLFSSTLASNQSGHGGNNLTPGSGGNGGAIYSSGLLALSACTLSGNSAGNAGSGPIGSNGGSGGGIFSSTAISLHSCTLFGNTAGNASGTVNTGGSGGGIYCFSASLTACTLVGNRTGTGYLRGNGGGLNGTQLTLRHSLIAQNSRGSSPNDVTGTSLSYVGANLLGTAATGTATGPAPVINPDPKLAPFSDYGGPTFAMLPLPGSPAINPSGGSSNRIFDQRGLPMNGVPDIGAVETQAALVGFIDTDTDGMDDRLEPLYGFNVGMHDGSLDYDGDGSSNKAELGNMTGPRDSTSLLKIVSLSRIGPNVIIDWTSFPGLNYTVEYGETLNFGFSSSLPTATGVVSGLAISYNPSRAFFRIRRN